MTQQSLVPLKAPTHQENSAVRLQRKCACESTGETCSRCASSKYPLQCRATNDTHLDSVPPIVNDVLTSPGQPIDNSTRGFMEERFGHDFSGVRIHTDALAAKSARSIDAMAYTVGRDIAFGTGQYVPHTSAGQHLLAHELAHVVQQSDLGNEATQVGKQQAEVQADSAADEALRLGRRVSELGAADQGLYCSSLKRATSAEEVKMEHKVDLIHLKELLILMLRTQSPEIQAEIDDWRTIAIALVEVVDEENKVFRTIVYAASKNWNNPALEEAADRLGILRLGHKGVDPREEGARTESKAAKDAEQLLIEGADQADMIIRGMAVSRKVCKHCSEAISEQEQNIKVTWLDPAERKNAFGAGRLHRRGSGAMQKALFELHQAFEPTLTAAGQESQSGTSPDSPLWAALNALDIKELYRVVDFAQRTGKLDILARTVDVARNVDVLRLKTVMSALLYKEESLRPSPNGLRLLTTGSILINGLDNLPPDQREYLERNLRPATRSLVKTRTAPNPKTKSAKPEEKKKPTNEEKSTSTGIGGIVKNALVVGGVILTGLALIELAEAIASALFFEVVLAAGAEALKGATKDKVKEVVTRELKVRVQASPQQIEKVAETIFHEIEHYAQSASKAIAQ
jgi:hypothetical protein